MVAFDWNRVLPVLVSIAIIIMVAVLRQYSKTIAAIVATMPLNIPLGMWIVYAGADEPNAALTEFSQAVLVNIFPTVFFMVAAWQTTKAGWGLLPTLALGYFVWAVSLGLVLLVQAWLR